MKFIDIDKLLSIEIFHCAVFFWYVCEKCVHFAKMEIVSSEKRQKTTQLQLIAHSKFHLVIYKMHVRCKHFEKVAIVFDRFLLLLD